MAKNALHTWDSLRANLPKARAQRNANTQDSEDEAFWRSTFHSEQPPLRPDQDWRDTLVMNWEENNCVYKAATKAETWRKVWNAKPSD